MFFLCVCEPETRMVSQGTQGIAQGMHGDLQAVSTGLSWEAAGFKHMGTAAAAAASQLRPCED